MPRFGGNTCLGMPVAVQDCKLMPCPGKQNVHSVLKVCNPVNIKYFQNIPPTCHIPKLKVFPFLQVCSRQISIVNSDRAFSSLYNTSNALTDGPCDIKGISREPNPQNGNYLLAPNSLPNFGFVIGFGCREMITKAQMRNAQNGRSNDRY